MAEDEELPPLRGDSYQERLARADERELVLGEVADEGTLATERNRAIIALLISILVPTLVLFGATVLAGLAPALQAARANPSLTLRRE